MRNLKRALSLALASVMLMGMMVVGTSAGYSDVSSENNQEAIEVLQAVGIMTGDENGKFNPDANVTRNEMAVVMCNLLDYTVASYKGTAPFTDVPSWAEPYVAACYTNGIIAGYSSTTFGGNDSVTTGQAALMLLKALGYFQYQSDFGEDWLVETTKQGAIAELFDDVDTGATEALTRNDVAQLVLNALEANMVMATGDGGTTVTGDGFQITTGKATYEERTSTNSKYGKIDNERADRNDGKYVIQLGEDLYNGDLEKKENRTDAFGRPATQWDYEGDEIGTYAGDADQIMVINKELDYAEVMMTDDDYFDLKASEISEDVEVYLNGDKQTTYAADFFKAGDVVELFENDDDEVATVAVTRYTLAKIDSVDDDLSSSLEKQGASYAIDLTDLDSGLFADASVDGGTYYDDHSDSDLVLPGFAASTYTEGTVIAVAADSDGVILASHVTTAVEGTISSYNSGSKASVTVDGTAYPITTLVKGTAPNFSFNDDTYTVYVNADGYVIGYETTGSVKLEDVYYVTGVVADASGLYSSDTYYAQAVALDGTISEIKLEADSFLALASIFTSSSAGDTNYYVVDASGTYYLQNDGTFSTSTNGSTKYARHATLTAAIAAVGAMNELIVDNAGLYTFTDKDGSLSANAKSNNGKFTAEVYNHAADSSYYVSAGTSLSEDLKRDASSVALAGASGDFTKKAYVDSKTQYIKIEEPGEDIDVATVAGGTSATTATTNAVAVIASKSGNNYTAAYVVLVSNAGFDAAAADADIIYVDSASTNKVASDQWELTAYFMDGSGEQTIIADTAAADNSFYTYTINDEDVYELTDITADADYFAYDEDALADVDYDDETGLVSGATLTGVYNDQLTGWLENAVNSSSNDFRFDDVDFSADVVVIDSRSKADKNADLVTGDITTVAKLKSAIEKSGNTVVADVYLDDGQVILVSVISMTDADEVGEDDVDPAYTLETAPTVTLSASTVSFTGTVIHEDGSTPSGEITGLTVTVTVEERVSGQWVELDTVTREAQINTSGNLNVTSASVAVVAGTSYRVTITLSGDDFGTMTLFQGTRSF